jgi:hypothetical protein
MSQTSSDDVHQHSGWLIPLAFLALILLLSGLFLLYYLRPGPRDAVPDGDVRMVALSVEGRDFQVPANYIKTAAARRGGAQKTLALVALLPGLAGYSAADAKRFASNAPDSPVINILLRGGRSLAPDMRLARIYRPALADNGVQGSFDLTRYSFRAGSGYERNDLFAGHGAQGLVLLLCEKPLPDFPSPNCIAVDRPLGDGVNLSYRFKRAYLSRWAGIATGVDGLLKRFSVQPR